MTRSGKRWARAELSPSPEQIERAEGINNGYRPHGGYRGKPEHPPTFAAFQRSQEPELFARPDNEVPDFSEIRRDELRTPDYVFEYLKGGSSSDEFPLFSHKLLAVSKVERDGYLNFPRELLRPTKCNPPMKDAAGRTYYRPNKTHQYLTATDLKNCTRNEVNIQLGKPTRTTLLRARQRCNSAPAKRQQLRHQEQDKMIENRRPLSARVTARVAGMVNRVSTGSDSYGAYIVGARYNRAHCVDAQTLTKYGTYISRENPGHCFTLQADTEPEIEIPDVTAVGGTSPVTSPRLSRDVSYRTSSTIPSTSGSAIGKSSSLLKSGGETSRQASANSRRTPSGAGHARQQQRAFAGGSKYMSLTFYRNPPKPASQIHLAGATFPGGIMGPCITKCVVRGDLPPGRQKLTVKDISKKLKEEENVDMPIPAYTKNVKYNPNINTGFVSGHGVDILNRSRSDIVPQSNTQAIANVRTVNIQNVTNEESSAKKEPSTSAFDETELKHADEAEAALGEEISGDNNMVTEDKSELVENKLENDDKVITGNGGGETAETVENVITGKNEEDLDETLNEEPVEDEYSEPVLDEEPVEDEYSEPVLDEEPVEDEYSEPVLEQKTSDKSVHFFFTEDEAKNQNPENESLAAEINETEPLNDDMLPPDITGEGQENSSNENDVVVNDNDVVVKKSDSSTSANFEENDYSIDTVPIDKEREGQPSKIEVDSTLSQLDKQ